MGMAEEAKNSVKKKPKEKGKKKSFSEMFIPGKNDSTAEIISKLITIAAMLVVIVCVVILGIYAYHSIEAKNNHNNLKVIYQQAKSNTTAAVTEATTAADDDDDAPQEEKPVERPPLVVLPAAQELLDINPDTVGYVNIPGCVDEPVVKGEDDEYYLNHNFYNNQRQCGTCFADFRNNVGPYDRSDNVVLYAHNQKDGTMFGNLDYYRWDPAYWLKNPFIYFNTNYSEDAYVIIASFVINTTPEQDNGRPVFDYQNYINFNDDTYTYEYFISEVLKRSQFITGIECSKDDKYLTLSTCSTEWDDSRHLLIARKLRDGETTENIDTTMFEKNPNPKWPAIYYKYNGGTYIDEE